MRLKFLWRPFYDPTVYVPLYDGTRGEDTRWEQHVPKLSHIRDTMGVLPPSNTTPLTITAEIRQQRETLPEAQWVEMTAPAPSNSRKNKSPKPKPPLNGATVSDAELRAAADRLKASLKLR